MFICSHRVPNFFVFQFAAHKNLSVKMVFKNLCPTQNFNADYQLTAKQGADTLAFVSLVHSKLYPAIVS